MAYIFKGGETFAGDILKERPAFKETTYNYYVIKSNVVAAAVNTLNASEIRKDPSINPKLKIDENCIGVIAEGLIVNATGIFTQIPEKELLGQSAEKLKMSLLKANGTPHSESDREIMGKAAQEAVSRMSAIVKEYNLGNQQDRGVAG